MTSERQPGSQPHFARRLELRRCAGEHLRDRRSDIRIRRAARQLHPLVVHQRRPRVEEVEQVAEQRQMDGVAERYPIRRLNIDTADDGRSCLEAVDRLETRASRGFRNLAAGRVVRIRRERGYRFQIRSRLLQGFTRTMSVVATP
jgi:hypothetical protein